MARNRDYAAEYQARKAREEAAGSTVYGRRDARARARGWASYNEQRLWSPRLTDAYVRELAEEIGGPVEPDRAGSLMSREANRIINYNRHNDEQQRRPGDWRVRLLIAAGRITGKPRDVKAVRNAKRRASSERTRSGRLK